MEQLSNFLHTTGFSLMSWQNAAMIVVGLIFLSLAILKDYEPLLLVPIGFGILIGNIDMGGFISHGFEGWVGIKQLGEVVN